MSTWEDDEAETLRILANAQSGASLRKTSRSLHAGLLEKDERHNKERREREQAYILAQQQHKKAMELKSQRRFNSMLKDKLPEGTACGHTVVLFDRRTLLRSLYLHNNPSADSRQHPTSNRNVGRQVKDDETNRADGERGSESEAKQGGEDEDEDEEEDDDDENPEEEGLRGCRELLARYLGDDHGYLSEDYNFKRRATDPSAQATPASSPSPPPYSPARSSRKPAARPKQPATPKAEAVSTKVATTKAVSAKPISTTAASTAAVVASGRSRRKARAGPSKDQDIDESVASTVEFYAKNGYD